MAATSLWSIEGFHRVRRSRLDLRQADGAA
jgi:hypothetical protein